MKKLVEKGIVFYPLPDVSNAEFAFGANESMYFERNDLPDVPSEYKAMGMELFYNGGELPEFHPCVNRKEAHKIIRALLSSFYPSHEQKESTVGYALWAWSSKDSPLAEL